MSKRLIEKLLDVRNQCKGQYFDPDYDVKNQLFEKVYISKIYNFYPKLVNLFENDCKKLAERLGDNWYKNDLARYMLYRKYNIKDLRAKCDNFPICECDSSIYSQKNIYHIEDKNKLYSRPWLTIVKNNRTCYFADTMLPSWTILRALIEYCTMIEKGEIFDDDRCEDIAGRQLYTFKIPDEEYIELRDIVKQEIGTDQYEVVLCEYIINNIVSILEMFNKHLGGLTDLYDFIQLTHSGSGSNYIITPRELLNRCRDPYINSNVSQDKELPNSGRLWDYSDIPLLFISRWYMENVNVSVNVNKYHEQYDKNLMYLAKLKKPDKDIKNIKMWLLSYKNGYDDFIKENCLQDFVYKKDDEINLSLEKITNCDTAYSIEYGFPRELFRGHIYKYDKKNASDSDFPNVVLSGGSEKEDFIIPGYANGIDDFIQILDNFRTMSIKRRERLV